MARIRCKNGGRCKFDKFGICVRCGFDFTYKRISLIFINAYSFVLSFIMVVLGYDISLIFPNSFLSEITRALLDLNVVLGFLGVYFILLALLLLVSPLFLLPIRIMRKKRIRLDNRIIILNLILGFTGIGWVMALVLSLRSISKSINKNT